MFVEMRAKTSQKNIQGVIDKIQEVGCQAFINPGTEKQIIALLGDNTGSISTEIFEVLPGVEKVIRIMDPYKLVSRTFKEKNTTIKIKNEEIGGKSVIIAAGPCSVESREQILSCAHLVKSLGGKILRGGAYKPRTNNESFRGLDEPGLELLAEAGEKTGLLTITEVLRPEKVKLVSDYVDIIQVGARNMYNSDLLEEIGRTKKPVLLKRSFSATLDEWLAYAEYIYKQGNHNVILCERGTRTFDSSTRFDLNLGAMAAIKYKTHLPVMADPSHAAGNFRYVPIIAKGVMAAGADGLLIEVHPNPQKALSDGPQQLTFSDFTRLVKELKILAQAIGREI